MKTTSGPYYGGGDKRQNEILESRQFFAPATSSSAFPRFCSMARKAVPVAFPKGRYIRKRRVQRTCLRIMGSIYARIPRAATPMERRGVPSKSQADYSVGTKLWMLLSSMMMTIARISDYVERRGLEDVYLAMDFDH